MPAMATLEELKDTKKTIDRLKKKYPNAMTEVIDFLKKSRNVGYKNICKMVTGEATPESLKK